MWPPDKTCSAMRFIPTEDEVKKIHTAGKKVFLVGPLVAGTANRRTGRRSAPPESTRFSPTGHSNAAPVGVRRNSNRGR